jgi:hypothetical protein
MPLRAQEHTSHGLSGGSGVQASSSPGPWVRDIWARPGLLLPPLQWFFHRSPAEQSLRDPPLRSYHLPIILSPFFCQTQELSISASSLLCSLWVMTLTWVNVSPKLHMLGAWSPVCEVKQW